MASKFFFAVDGKNTSTECELNCLFARRLNLQDQRNPATINANDDDNY